MICIIPARGGSQRFPGKNIIDLYGIEVINRTIDICRRSRIFEMVAVSTDSEEIEASVKFLTPIYKRPDHLKGDSSETEVLKWHMDDMDIKEVCRVYPFACLLTDKRLKNGYNMFMNNGPDAVMECVKYSHPIQRAIDGITMRYITPAVMMEKTQDLVDRYHDAATFMFTTREALDLPLGERLIEWLEVPEIDAQDLDSPEDFELLKMKFERMHR